MRNPGFFTVAVASFATLLLASVTFSVPSSRAIVAPLTCDGNVCSGSLTVGGQPIRYEYTQHVNPDGKFRIRFDGGSYGPTTEMLSFILFDVPPFVSASAYANPNGTHFLPPESDITSGRNGYERRSSAGCPGGCDVDFAMSVDYAGLSEGAYDFSLYVFQLGASGSRSGLRFYVDGSAPGNGDETESLLPIGDTGLTCADLSGGNPVDNDLDYYPNCADIRCVGKQGHPLDAGLLCEIPETTCHDGFDNDGDGLADCLDPDCNLRCGRLNLSGTACTGYCQYGNEYGPPGILNGQDPCGDGFDNDGDGRTDCRDNREFLDGTETVFRFLLDVQDSPGSRICWRHPEYGCPVGEVGLCADDRDNDVDTSFGDDEYDAIDSTGRDCLDYDCAGDPACPSVEHRAADGSDAPGQCFDGIDNDLDHLIDCADPDCIGVENPSNPNVFCSDREFDLGQGINLCADVTDNDADGPMDCDDSDCRRKFGHCQWCPDHEDYRFDACADGLDNDTGEGADCRDPDCLNRPGQLSGAAYCRATESSGDPSRQCSDGLDNDADGLIDCRDPDCEGVTTAGGYVCQSGGETGGACFDQADNDGDDLLPAGGIDCLDEGCWGQASCAPMDWQVSACQSVPDYSGPVWIAETDPSVSANVMTASRVGQKHTIAIRGTGSYPDFAVFVGTASGTEFAYPYADVSCTVSNPSVFNMTVVPGKALMVYAVAPVTDPSLDITCDLPASPTSSREFTVSLSATKGSGLPEYGERIFRNRVYEENPPVVNGIEVEGWDGVSLTVPYGAQRQIRIVPSDPFQPDPLDSSGICRCRLGMDYGGTRNFVSDSGKCVIDPIVDGVTMRFRNRGTMVLTAGAEDGADNIGADSSPLSVPVTVTPIANGPLKVSRPESLGSDQSPFFDPGRSAYREMGLSVSFTAANNVGFIGNPCRVEITDSAGSLIGSASFPDTGAGNLAICQDSIDLSSVSLSDQNHNPDTHYFVQVGISDADGNSVASERREFYICRTLPTPDEGEGYNPCHWADFDGDRATEGYYTDLYAGSTEYGPAYRPCDNCVGLENPGQEDWNLDGIGDSCTQLGRCDKDRDYACSWYSYGYVPDDPVTPDSCALSAESGCCLDENDPTCCPAPTWATDESGDSWSQQSCRTDWGLCEVTGFVCFGDPDCPIEGQCFDSAGQPQDRDGDMLIDACHVDADCVEGFGDICAGAERCISLIFPWVEAPRGNVRSGSHIRFREVPPENRFNATFCITAKGLIETTNGQPTFRTELCPKTDIDTELDRLTVLERPGSINHFSTALGRIDMAGLLDGRYGEVVRVRAADFGGVFPAFSGQPLGGKVYLIEGEDLEVLSDVTVPDSVSDTVDASGTVVVRGGSITFRGNVEYQPVHFVGLQSVRQVASVGWMAIDREDRSGGNIYVDEDVTDLAGAFFSAGQGGFYTVAPPATDSPEPLTVKGLLLARQFHLSRSYRSEERGSERFEYDGRAILNPPPGFGDLSKSLPVYGAAPPLP
ncbi:hypothetical protein JW899_01705 [Candidatus Uhrbacteria bacterium]|nr:hypothetical protein [Candidatus Uhrbacteria bacterium]